MGSTQSGTRELVLQNPKESSILKISRNVASRLKGDEEQKDVYKELSKLDHEINRENTNTQFISSHCIKTEIENQINDNNVYWQKRLDKLEENFKSVESDLDNAYKTAVQDVNNAFVKNIINDNVDSCLTSREKVIDCYTKNGNQPLLCNKEVEDFSQCISMKVGLLFKN